MEFNKTDLTVSSYKRVYESNLEQSVDTDFTLPDYYPEIVKILKVIPEINIMSSQCTANGVGIGGQVVLTLLYYGSDDKINSYTHICPFTKSQDAEVSENGCVSVQPFVGYMNSKAIAPRKVEVHGSLALSVAVDSVENKSILSSTDCEGIYLKSAEKPFLKFYDVLTKSVFIEDEIQISQNAPAIEKVIRNSATATITECKFISGKAVVKGDVKLEILYCPTQSNKPILLTEVKGFSQIFDCSVECENPNFESSVRVECFEIHPKTGLDGDVRNIAFETRLGVQIIPYCMENNNIVIDAFTGKYIADIKYDNINAETVAENIFENFVCKKKIEFGDALTDISDIWSKVSVDYTAKDNNCVLVKGTVNVFILGIDGEGKPTYFERPIEYEYRYELNKEIDNLRCRPQISVVAIQYSLSAEGTIELSAELKITATVYSVESVRAVTGVSVDFDSIVYKDSDTAMILYYPENETVWDIARKYCTCPKKICEANGLDDAENLCNSVLLIPNI